MSYSKGHPVRLVAGRLALDFLNTANWSQDGTVVDEKLTKREDVVEWLAALELSHARLPEDLSELRGFRNDLRTAFRGDAEMRLHLESRQLTAHSSSVRSLPLLDLVGISAAALLADHREMSRLKICPGKNCGWMFIDETKNGRRQWCTMDLCGNRAKAARHYKRTRQDEDLSDKH